MNRITVDTDVIVQISSQVSQMEQSVTQKSTELLKLLRTIHFLNIENSTIRASLYDNVSKMKALASKCDRSAVQINKAAELLSGYEKALIQKLLNGIPSVAPEPDPLSEEFTAETKEEYYKMIEARAQNAIDPDTRKLYEKYKGRIHLGSDTIEGTAYYQPFLNKVYIDWEEDAENARGFGSTYFHEVGHMVDDYTKFFGDSSSGKAFTVSLESDFENYISKTMKEGSMTREEAYDSISEWLWEDADNKSGLSDLMGGLSNNECVGAYGHFGDYWDGGDEHGIPKLLNNEAFAHFFEASMSTDSVKLNYLKEVFPSAYAEYQTIVRKHIE